MPRGSREKEVLFYPPYAKDIRNLLLEYLKRDSMTLTDFKEEWKSQKFSLIHTGKPDDVSRRVFIQELFCTCLGYLMLGNPLALRVAVLYTLYCLYYTQPQTPKVKMNISIEMFHELLKLREDVKKNNIIDAYHVLNKLRYDNAFCYSAFVKIDPMLSSLNPPQKLTKPLPQSISEANTLKDVLSIPMVSTLSDQYHSIKQSYSAWANRSIVPPESQMSSSTNILQSSSSGATNHTTTATTTSSSSSTSSITYPHQDLHAMESNDSRMNQQQNHILQSSLNIVKSNFLLDIQNTLNQFEQNRENRMKTFRDEILDIPRRMQAISRAVRGKRAKKSGNTTEAPPGSSSLDLSEAYASESLSRSRAKQDTGALLRDSVLRIQQQGNLTLADQDFSSDSESERASSNPRLSRLQSNILPPSRIAPIIAPSTSTITTSTSSTPSHPTSSNLMSHPQVSNEVTVKQEPIESDEENSANNDGRCHAERVEEMNDHGNDRNANTDQHSSSRKGTKTSEGRTNTQKKRKRKAREFDIDAIVDAFVVNGTTRAQQKKTDPQETRRQNEGNAQGETSTTKNKKPRNQSASQQKKKKNVENCQDEHSQQKQQEEQEAPAVIDKQSDKGKSSKEGTKNDKNKKKKKQQSERNNQSEQPKDVRSSSRVRKKKELPSFYVGDFDDDTHQ